MKTYCESCLPKQELFTLEDVEHIIEHVVGIDLPDALRMVQETHKYHQVLRRHGTEPCWDCKHMMPVLLHINEARGDD